jgi:indoleamine 2,3-dioxygenase
MKKITTYVHPERGFLPDPDPLLELPLAYRAWDELNNAMPELLHNNDFRDALNNIPLLDPSGIKNGPELDRSMRQLSMFANAYISCGPDPVKKIPLVLAVPLTEVAEMSGRPPISSHASIVLNNWARINPKGPIELENIITVVRKNQSSSCPPKKF